MPQIGFKSRDNVENNESNILRVKRGGFYLRIC